MEASKLYWVEFCASATASSHRRMTMEATSAESLLENDAGTQDLPDAAGSSSTDDQNESHLITEPIVSDMPPPSAVVSAEGSSTDAEDVSLPVVPAGIRQVQEFVYSEIPDSEDFSDTMSMEAGSVQGDLPEANLAAIEEDDPDGQTLPVEVNSTTEGAIIATQSEETPEDFAEETTSLPVDSNEANISSSTAAGTRSVESLGDDAENTTGLPIDSNDISSSTVTVNHTSELPVADVIASTVKIASDPIEDSMAEVPASDASDEEFSDANSPMNQPTMSNMTESVIADAALPDEAETTPLPTTLEYPIDSPLPEETAELGSDDSPGLEPSFEVSTFSIDELVQEEINDGIITSADTELPSTTPGASVDLDTVMLEASEPTIEQQPSSARDSSTEPDSQAIQETSVITDIPDLHLYTIAQRYGTSRERQNTLINPASSTPPPSVPKVTSSKKSTPSASSSAPEGSQNKDIFMAELKAMKIVSPNSYPLNLNY